MAGRQPSNRRLAKLAAAPVLFNINELMVFGLPLVLNPTLLIPFLLVPLMATCTSSLAVVLGLVPVTTHAVQWTVPAILSGYAATGSVAGSVLQAVNIVLGVLIYLPFVRRLETRRQEDLRESVDRLTGLVRQAEKTGEAPRLLEAPPRLAAVAKMLLADLRHDVKAGEVELYYQPQMRLDGTIYGGEALLRWHHAELGYLYPPLVIALAREDGCLDDLELLVARKTCADLCRLGKEIAAPLELSFNITPDRLSDDRFVDQLREQLAQLDFGPHHLGVEITEQVALSSTDEMDKRLPGPAGLRAGPHYGRFRHGAQLHVVFAEPAVPDGQAGRQAGALPDGKRPLVVHHRLHCRAVGNPGFRAAGGVCGNSRAAGAAGRPGVPAVPGIFVQSGVAAGRVHGVRRQIYRCATGRRPGKTACRNGVTRWKPRKP